jgi:hypothetical protein
MVSRDALAAQLSDAFHSGGELAIMRIGFLPLGLADQ